VLLSSILCWDDRNYGWLVVHPIPTKKIIDHPVFFTSEHVITWLVVLKNVLTILKNMKVNGKDYISHILWNIKKNMFETTKQLL